ncbi:MAG: DUF1549 domain-containing protein [Gemmataceae bacterium]
MLPSLLLLAVVGASPTPSPAEVEFFEKQIRPLLAARCTSCHGAKNPRGGLRLDTAAGIHKGGDTGPAVLPGKTAESLLLRSIRYEGDLRMPPKGKLTPGEIALLESWVRRGAALPSEKVESASKPLPASGPLRSTHWAFQPLSRSVVPAAPAGTWLPSPVDRFLAARLAARGITPAPPADKRTLLRRITLDLTGLPPTFDEVNAFLADTRPDAYERLVDRLLASPAYGERWGRHWLDVARYADSNGMDENLVQAQAWRYRDYVLAAFNHDLPYDRFVREQLAGDLLPNPTPDQLVATGFLALGPKMLAEDDPVKMQMDIVDEQIDTIGKTFLGLTLGCARCHDHKYDPIPTSDYYGLAGIFKSTRVMDTYTVVARWHERPLGTQSQLDAFQAQRRAIDTARQAVTARTRQADDQLRASLRAQVAAYVEAGRDLQRRRAAFAMQPPALPGKPPEGTLLVEAEHFTRGNVKKEFTGYGEKIGVIYNAGPLPNLAEYDLTVPRAGLYQFELRYAAADARPIEVAVNGQVIASEAARVATGSWFPDTQKWFAEAVVFLPAGKSNLRLRREGPFPHIDRFALVPRTAPPGTEKLTPITADQLARQRGLQARFLDRWAAFLAQTPDATPEQITKAANDTAGPFALPKPADPLYPEATRNDLAKLRATLTQREAELRPLPEAMGATEGTVTDVRVHIRGNHLTLGDTVPRRFPRLLAGENQTALAPTQSGRRELADWLTRPEHPLTARVLVNRLWHWHFGIGLVRSTDNFGTLGDTPTHPDLLDWLARQFIEDGWSIKALHRRILLSAAYQRSAAFDPVAAERDPDNRLHWRWQRRRLHAEELRDSLLAVAGSLDRTMSGSLFQGNNRGYVPGYPNGIYDRYDFPRRSVYLPVIRSMLYDVFQSFDFPDPSTPNGERASTTIAPQALFALNGQLMTDQSLRFARSLVESASTDEARLHRAYERAFGRAPTAAEVVRASSFLHRLDAEWARQNLPASERPLRVWQGFCRVLLAANEFVFLE